ncbi:type IX secretion system membrane protein PorP/SprF [Flaviaesturariibacter flavus]|uniref:Type IX secretion system membrane protein PorP/SprF n=1 Tax=Flaviaesturariibacter flavus TaxID=2502780 RepID=A0A4R1BB63_9BACT|nr:PorP/SprF family type IX secretion system membrane protein [Flaviaesturariibacter flavus]TCJ14219.1 type IX secretion system membrane protein PorP/SprF [Flaviaesturariibacter flavus]
MKRSLAICLLALVLAGKAGAQTDPHFSQYFVFPTSVNPAFTGAFDGAYRVTGVYRNQWSDMSGGFRTVGFAAEANTNRNVAIGANVFQQTTGTGYTFQQAYASFAYNGVRFDPEGYKVLTIALQAGMISKRFDASKFQTEEQWNRFTGFNPSVPATEVLMANKSTVFDAGAGIMYADLSEDKKINPYIGVAAHHITSPEEFFLSGTQKTKVPMRLTAHVSLGINVSETLIVTPSVLYMRQGSADEQMFGVNVRSMVGEEVSLLGGVNYRFNDAVVPFAGLQWGNTKLGVSYDVSQSDLGKNVARSNSFEISLTCLFNRPAEAPRYLRCPSF